MKDYEAFNDECIFQIRGFLFGVLYNDVPEDVKDRIYDRMDKYIKTFSRLTWQSQNDDTDVMFDCWKDIHYKIIGYVNALIDCRYMICGSNVLVIDILYRLFELINNG